MASGTVPVPGLVLVSCCLGVWVSKFPLSERRDPWQSLVTAVPRPNSASAPPRLPSPCPALPVHAGHREKASEGEAWQPTLPGSWTSISSHYVESAHCPVGGPQLALPSVTLKTAAATAGYLLATRPPNHRRGRYSSHFTEEESKVQQSSVICQRLQLMSS